MVKESNRQGRTVSESLEIAEMPEIRLFPNPPGYKQMIVEKNINVPTHCNCHGMPVTGKAHIAYFGNQTIACRDGIVQIVKYCCQASQGQEALTLQIAEILQKVAGTSSVAVLLEASYQCSVEQGEDNNDKRVLTSEYTGKFVNTDIKREFLQYAGY